MPDIDIEIANATSGDGTPTGGKTAVVIDRKSQRAWSGEGQTESEAATKALRSFIGDRRAREYVE